MVFKIQKLSFWAWQGKDLCHLVGSRGGGHSPVWGRNLGWQNSRNLLSCSSLWLGSLEIALGEGKAVAANGCCHYASAYLQKQSILLSVGPVYKVCTHSPVWLPRPSDMCLPQYKPSPNLPSCGRRNCCLFSTCVFRGQESVFCWQELHRPGFGVSWGSPVSSPWAWQESQHPSWKFISKAVRA